MAGRFCIPSRPDYRYSRCLRVVLRRGRQSLESSCESETRNPLAIKSRFRIEIFRLPRSTSARKLRSIPIFSAITTCVQPRFFRNLRIRSPRRVSRSSDILLHHRVCLSNIQTDTGRNTVLNLGTEFDLLCCDPDLVAFSLLKQNFERLWRTIRHHICTRKERSR